MGTNVKAVCTDETMMTESKKQIIVETLENINRYLAKLLKDHPVKSLPVASEGSNFLCRDQVCQNIDLKL